MAVREAVNAQVKVEVPGLGETSVDTLTGLNQFWFDPDDPLRAGYLLEA